MYQLMLVDDEDAVIEGLAITIPWDQLGIETVYKANSGREALKLLEKHSIDIVITDIRMPGISGLELIETIRAKWKGTKCILLSGFAEFEYAKQALENETEDYLLKPVEDEDLIRVVRRVQDKLKREWEEASSRRRTLQTVRDHLPLLRTQLLKELLTRSHWEERNLADRLALLELPFTPGDRCALVLVRLEEHFYDYNNRSFSLFQYAIGNIAEELFAGHFGLWHCMDDHDYLVLLVQAPAAAENAAEAQAILERLAAQLQKSVKLYLKGTVSVMVGQWTNAFPQGLRLAYEDAVGVLLRRAGNESEMFVTGSVPGQLIEVMALHTLYEPPLLMHLLEAGRWDEAKAKLSAVFRELDERFGESAEHIREAYYTIAASFSYVAHKHQRLLADIAGSAEDDSREGYALRTVRQLREWAFRTMEKVREDTIREVKDARADVVRMIQQYVERHLDGDVSLQAVADYVHFHPVYLSKVYKMETGEAFTEYLYRLRMNKAAFWLKSGTYKVYEISEMLGYQNTPYFIKKFKKYFGKTPQEYRES
ncbi:response regulator [Paenibacillus sp. CF384]|uniref:response regulator n=1 Tax=Paenibacillus sp. CF384 TaxID=1884382 RepID=UPI000897267D|nr:response regulator [Paenibacillus sp. CF384]SDX93168.1 two-component system, response regulator YesN [Paenibacillus sp. CF384]